MANASTISVPSPDQIEHLLFPAGIVAAPELPTTWKAIALLTPHGGAPAGTTDPSDQLAAAVITYDASRADRRFLRAQLYQLESLDFHDIVFCTDRQSSCWWSLETSPDNADADPTAIHGPYTSNVNVAPPAFFKAFKHAGTWDANKGKSDAFSGKNTAASSTWLWTESGTNVPRRIMSVDRGNDFATALFGAYYFVDFTTFEAEPNGFAIFDQLSLDGPTAGHAVRTYEDILAAFDVVPVGLWQKCSHDQIAALLPGFTKIDDAPHPPSWTNKVDSQCFMIGQDDYPYYCQIWYDWNVGCQVTVFVQKGDDGKYSARFDEFLPKGAVGPAVVYQWSGAAWTLACTQAGGGDVPMPLPNFVATANGKCRANFRGSAYFGDLSIWSVALGDQHSWADFWYWFDGSAKGVVFSLSPASSLTIIDYQTFNQDGPFDAGKLFDPSSQTQACANQNLMALQRRPAFKVPMPLHH